MKRLQFTISAATVAATVAVTLTASAGTLPMGYAEAAELAVASGETPSTPATLPGETRNDERRAASAQEEGRDYQRKRFPRRAKRKKAKKVRRVIARTSWRAARVSWYGPGFYGRTMAGGGKLTPGSMVVAHRSLKFGTKIQFSYKGRRVIAVVRDRGPYISGRVFDLGPGTAKKLRFSGVGTVRWRIVK